MTTSLKEALDASWSADRTISFFDFSGPYESFSFQQFGRKVWAYERHLTTLGAGPGAVIAVMGPTCSDIAALCAAVWSVGSTLTVLANPTRLSGLEHFLKETLSKLRESGADVLIGEEECIAPLRHLAGIPVLNYQQVRQAEAEEPIQPSGHGNCALIQFSSGTTRSPKPIRLSADALLSNTKAVLDRFPGGASNHSCVSWLPLYHDMGLIGCFLMPILAPGDLTLMGPEVFAVRPLTWLKAISQQRATTSSAPNFALAHCVRRVTDEKVNDLDLSCWSIAMVGAEPVRPHTLEAFAKKFAPAGFEEKAFSPVYGLAEATLAVTFSPLSGGLRTASYDPLEAARSGRIVAGSRVTPSLGFPLEGTTVEIRQDGRVLGESEVGEVWVSSPSLMVDVENGWLDTGDCGFLLKGELYLYGRRRDILLLDGRNHDPNLVEESVEQLDAVWRCCAFMLETAEDRDRLVLVCEVSRKFHGDLDTLEESVRNACRRKAQLHADRVALVRPGEIPLTSSGKIRRQGAADKYLDGGFRVLNKPGEEP